MKVKELNPTPIIGKGQISFHGARGGEQQVFIQSVHIGTFFFDDQMQSFAFKTLHGHVTLLDTLTESYAKEYLRIKLLG